MKELFMKLYKLPPWLLLFYLLAALVLWAMMMYSLRKFVHADEKNYIELVVNLLLMFLGLVMILYMTYLRHASPVHKLVLFPLRPLYGMSVSTDYWQVSVMNIVLYAPFACGLTFLLKSHPARTTILICFSLSLAAEILQYYLGAGVSEVDDVIFNTFGGVLGTLPHSICLRARKENP